MLELQFFRREQGVIHETNNIPHVYQQNSHAEWLDCILFEKVQYYMQVYPSRNYIPMMISFLNYTSLPFLQHTFWQCYNYLGILSFIVEILLFQLGLPWWSYSCQCLNTETFAQGNRSFTTKTPSISYNICLYIRLVVTL